MSPGAVFIKQLKSNVYVSLTSIGSFRCYLYSHWLSKKQLMFLYEYGPRKVHGEDVTVPRVLLVTFTEPTKALVMKIAYKLQYMYTYCEYMKKISIKIT